MTYAAPTVRPRFTERQIDLLLAAVYVYREREGDDDELDGLFQRLNDMQADLAEGVSPASRQEGNDV